MSKIFLVITCVITCMFMSTNSNAAQQFRYCIDCSSAKVKSLAKRQLSVGNTIYIFDGDKASKWGWHTEPSNEKVDEQSPITSLVPIKLNADEKAAEKELKKVIGKINHLRSSFETIMTDVQLNFYPGEYNTSAALVATDPFAFALRVNAHLQSESYLLKMIQDEIEAHLETISTQIHSPLSSITSATSSISNNALTLEIQHLDGSITYVTVTISSRQIGGKVFTSTKVVSTVTKDNKPIPLSSKTKGVVAGQTYTDDSVDLDSMERALLHADIEMERQACQSHNTITCSTVRKTIDGKVYWSQKCTRASTECE